MKFSAYNYIGNIEKRLGWSGQHVWSFYGLAQGTAWCCGEISYTFNKIGRKNKFYGGKPVFYVPYAQQWMAKHYDTIYDYRGTGALKKARKGDIVIFMWTKGSRDHIGAVRKTTKSTSELLTVEGNTSGGIVDNRTRAKKYIYAVYRPPYRYAPWIHEDIVETAKEVSWPMGTPRSKRGYPNGAPKKAYKKALADVYPNRGGWSTQPRKGASCDVCVGVIVRASGADSKWPRGLDEIAPYCKTKRGKKLWRRIKNPKKSELLPGDILYQIYPSGGGHVVVYLGDGKVANAHYYGKSYPVIQKFDSQVKKASDCRTYYAYRRRVK